RTVVGLLPEDATDQIVLAGDAFVVADLVGGGERIDAAAVSGDLVAVEGVQSGGEHQDAARGAIGITAAGGIAAGLGRAVRIDPGDVVGHAGDVLGVVAGFEPGGGLVAVALDVAHGFC